MSLPICLRDFLEDPGELQQRATGSQLAGGSWSSPAVGTGRSKHCTNVSGSEGKIARRDRRRTRPGRSVASARDVAYLCKVGNEGMVSGANDGDDLKGDAVLQRPIRPFPTSCQYVQVRGASNWSDKPLDCTFGHTSHSIHDHPCQLIKDAIVIHDASPRRGPCPFSHHSNSSPRSHSFLGTRTWRFRLLTAQL